MTTTTNLPRRPYGPNAFPLSIVAMGGIVVKDAEQAHANRVVAKAVERGVNYFDVAPQYGDAQDKLGPALEPYRKDCFLACKTLMRTAAEAREDFAQSCKRLRTDYFDLYQLHAMTKMDDDVDVAFGAGGVIEFVKELKRDGRIRHAGFSAHSIEAAMAAMDRYDFDSILFPINFASFHTGDFGPTVVAEANRRGLSILALKAMARGAWGEGDPLRKKYTKCWYRPLDDPRKQELALRFTLSQPITAAVPPGEEDLFWRAVDIAEKFEPITEAETDELRALANEVTPVFRRK
jgi:aryl-alcohol dehydrogenase-like predicted oxidoreductase